MIKNFLEIISTALQWGFGIFKAKNSPEMVKAKENQQKEIDKAKINDAIEKRDVKEIQNELSE